MLVVDGVGTVMERAGVTSYQLTQLGENIIFKNGHDSGIDTFEVTKSENIITRTNCSRKVREIESGSLQM